MKNITRLIIAFISIVLVNNTLPAQGIELTIDKSTESIDHTFTESLLFAKEDSVGKIFTAQKVFKSSSTPKGYHIKRFSRNMEFEERVMIESRNNELRGMFVNKTRIFLVQYEYSAVEKAYKINLLSSGKDSFNFEKSNLYTIKRDKVDKYEKFGHREKSSYPHKEEYNPGGILVSSENGKYHCYSLRLKKSKSAQNLFLIFNENFELISSDTYEEKIKGKLLINDVAITNEGVVYFLGREYRKNLPVSRIIPFVNNHKIHLHRLVNGEFNEVDFNKQEFSSGFAYLTTTNGNIYVFGYFSDEEGSQFKSGNFMGIFRSEINSENNKVNQYDKYYFRDFLKNKQGEPVKTIHTDLALKNVFVENGDLIFNSEVYFTGGNNNACLHVENSLSAKFDKHGKLSWMRILNKKQFSCWGWGKKKIGKFSFINLYDSGKLYFLTHYDLDSKDEIDDGPLSNLITMNTLNGASSQSRWSSSKASAVYYWDEINLNNQAVIAEGMDIYGNPVLLKITLNN